MNGWLFDNAYPRWAWRWWKRPFRRSYWERHFRIRRSSDSCRWSREPKCRRSLLQVCCSSCSRSVHPAFPTTDTTILQKRSLSLHYTTLRYTTLQNATLHCFKQRLTAQRTIRWYSQRWTIYKVLLRSTSSLYSTHRKNNIALPYATLHGITSHYSIVHPSHYNDREQKEPVSEVAAVLRKRYKNAHIAARWEPQKCTNWESRAQQTQLNVDLPTDRCYSYRRSRCMYNYTVFSCMYILVIQFSK